MRTFKLHVLECDTPVPAVLETDGPYRTIFERFVRRGLEAYTQDGGTQEIDLHVSASNVVDMGELPSPQDVDCLMLTGSSKSASPPLIFSYLLFSSLLSRLDPFLKTSRVRPFHG